VELPLPKLAFLDLETTGLDPASDEILEIGIVLTDRDLNTLATFQRVVCWPEIRYDTVTGEYEIPFGVHDVVEKMHQKTGLWEESYRSTKDLETVLTEAAFWLGQQNYENSVKGLPLYMAGNTIGFDRSFLQYKNPNFLGLFHYRSVDVSSLRILYEEWVENQDGPVEPSPRDADEHRVIPDCHDSINKLRFFRRKLFDA
jgi:oligoribonuclease